MKNLLFLMAFLMLLCSCSFTNSEDQSRSIKPSYFVITKQTQTFEERELGIARCKCKRIIISEDNNGFEYGYMWVELDTDLHVGDTLILVKK